MNTQNILLVMLALSTVTLVVLLVYRIRQEKRQLEAIRRMRLEDFSDFLRTNSVKGSVVEVARKVSDLLITSFGCSRIVFLRKKRGALELNFYHGLKDFGRDDFRLTYSNELASALRADFMPRRVPTIAQILPATFAERLGGLGLDVFFPVFWRENLYGVYFIRSNIETRSPSFALLVAGLAQSLSAAYHIRWHESKYDSMERQLTELKQKVPGKTESGPQETRFLKLIKHRHTETMVNRILDSLKEAAHISNLAYVYAPRDENSEPIAVRRGLQTSVDVPDKEVLAEIVTLVGQKPYVKLDELTSASPRVQRWQRRLRDAGLTYVASFPLTPRRSGVLAWSSDTDAGQVEQQLSLYRSHASPLVENAESFEMVEELSYTDGLTGLANQRYFFKRLYEEIDRARRYSRSLALIIFDLDELKYINDTFGHLAGDAVLRQMGNILRKSIRAIDVVARYGGDEFCVIMPEADSLMCSRFMERLQTEIMGAEFTVDGADKPLICTVSMGGAVFPNHAEDSRKLIFAADMALLRAKEEGRNRALLYTETR